MRGTYVEILRSLKQNSFHPWRCREDRCFPLPLQCLSMYQCITCLRWCIPNIRVCDKSCEKSGPHTKDKQQTTEQKGRPNKGRSGPSLVCRQQNRPVLCSLLCCGCKWWLDSSLLCCGCKWWLTFSFSSMQQRSIQSGWYKSNKVRLCCAVALLCFTPPLTFLYVCCMSAREWESESRTSTTTNCKNGTSATTTVQPPGRGQLQRVRRKRIRKMAQHFGRQKLYSMPHAFQGCVRGRRRCH